MHRSLGAVGAALLVGPVLVVACTGGGQLEIASVPSRPAVASASASAEAGSASPEVGSGAQADSGAGAGTATPPSPEGPDAAACPGGMVLVEGEYCTEVEQNCLQWWFDESNKKKVCEVFDPDVKCVGERVTKRFCIDQYSWPNVKGERPEVMNRWYEAQVKCAAVGKRMCTESEWTFACEGPDAKPFPYGYVRDPRKCNGDHPWDGPDMNKVAQRDPKELARLWKGVRSGSQPDCVSDFGVHDLPANNDEVVASEHHNDSGWKGKFDSIHTGGPWYKGVRNQCRPKIYTHDEGFYYYFLGFRCCSEPDGAATDPRTPRQIKKSWEFDRVERLAGVTREEVREHLERKRQDGDCGCDEIPSSRKRVRCKTICGTLLGSEATDAVQPPAEGLPPFGAKKRASDADLQRALRAGEK